MCELIAIQSLRCVPNHAGSIDPILRTPHDSKYHLIPVHDFVTSIIYSRVG